MRHFLCASILISLSIVAALEGEEIEVSLLELETAASYKSCYFVGHFHARSDMTTKSDFNVMGEREWIALRGQLGPDQKPVLDVQVTQRAVDTENRMTLENACQPRLHHVTAGKDMGLKCGDNYILFEAMKSTKYASKCTNVDTDYNPTIDHMRMFLKGSIVDPNSQQTLDFDYDGYSPNKLNHTNKKVYFGDGSGFFTVGQMFCEDGCTRDSKERNGKAGSLTLSVTCGEDQTTASRIHLSVSQCCQGAFSSDFYIYVPKANTRQATLTSATLRNGLCGGDWDRNTVEGEKWYQDHVACLDPKNVGDRYFYKGTGNGQPGSPGLQSVSHFPAESYRFYTTHECLNSFVPDPAESIFRMFELGTKGKSWSYDAYRWTNDGKVSETSKVIDVGKMDESRAKCVEIRRKIDNRVDSQFDKDSSKDKNLLHLTESCAEDEYLGLEWTEQTMVDAICEFVQAEADIERIDIYCAQENLQALRIDKKSVEQLGNSNAAAMSNVEAVLDKYLGYEVEMKKSQETIEYWDDGKCILTSLDVEKLNVDCSVHSFKDTTQA